MEYASIGTTLGLQWLVEYYGGAAFPLSELSTRLFMVTSRGKTEITDFVISDNMASWTFDTSAMFAGSYSFILRITDNDKLNIRLVWDHALRLSSFNGSTADMRVLTHTSAVDPLSTAILAYKQLDDEHIDNALTSIAELNADMESTTERLNLLELAGASISFTASPSVISSGMSTNVTLDVSVSGLGDAGADKIEILDSGSQVIAESSGTNLSKQVTLSVGASYTARVTHGSALISKSLSVVAVGHIYYGSGTDASDFESNKVVYTSPTTSVARTYSVVGRNQGDYVFFRIPSTMTINKATLNGFGFPMSLIETADGYKLYRSDNTYNAGTIQLVIS